MRIYNIPLGTAFHWKAVKGISGGAKTKTVSALTFLKIFSLTINIEVPAKRDLFLHLCIRNEIRRCHITITASRFHILSDDSAEDIEPGCRVVFGRKKFYTAVCNALLRTCGV